MILLFLAFIVFVAGCTDTINEQISDKQPSDEQIRDRGRSGQPLNVNLELSQYGVDATLIFQVESLSDEEELNITIKLPEGIEIVEGNLKQTYYKISANDKINHEFTIKVIEAGDYVIFGSAISDWQPSSYYLKGDQICIRTQDSGVGYIGVLGEIQCYTGVKR